MISLLMLILALSHSLLIAGLKINVLVTGAAGRTGKLVFEKLLASEEYNPVGIVRTPQSAKKLLKSFPAASEENVVYATIADKGLLESAIKDSKASKLILCTSATPKLQKRSLFKILFKKFVLFSKNPGRRKYCIVPLPAPSSECSCLNDSDDSGTKTQFLPLTAWPYLPCRHIHLTFTPCPSGYSLLHFP